jgi:transposase
MGKRDETQDPRMSKALSRYAVVSRYLALKPRRGLKRKLLEKLATEQWEGPNGEPFWVSAETIRAWVRRYRRSGLQGLMDKERQRPGVEVLTEEQQALICAMKKEVPMRSLERIIKIAEETGMVEQGVLRRSTVHRVLQAQGLSKRGGRTPDKQDLDRFEADYANDLWQSDMLAGPWLPDPDRPGKVRIAKLFLFMDDHSRLLLHGRFSFPEDLPHMELVFRRSIQKHGLCRCVYFDNGKVYRAAHIKQMTAELGIHRVVYTECYRPEGHGKIEALNRYIRAAFLAELEASNISTLDELNEAFIAWADKDYNHQIHSETGETPRARWERGIKDIRFADEETLRRAFLWREFRTTDKTGVFSLFGIRYQAGPGYGRKRIQIRFDPEALHSVELWDNGSFVQRIKPFSVSAQRRPKVIEENKEREEKTPVVDYLGHLVNKRRSEGIIEPSPKELKQKALEQREQNIAHMFALLDDRLDKGVVDSAHLRSFMDTYGPIDTDLAEIALEEMFESGAPKDLHVSVYLAAIRDAVRGGKQ